MYSVYAIYQGLACCTNLFSDTFSISYREYMILSFDITDNKAF